MNIFRKIDNKIDQWGMALDGKKVTFYPEIVGPALCIIFAVVVLLLMPSQIKINTTRSVTARTFPTILMGIILVFSTILLVKELYKMIRKIPVHTIELEVLSEIKALILLLMLIGYYLLMKWIGFIPSSVLFSVAMLYYFRVKNWKYYIIVVSAALIIGVVFRYVLHVRLP